MNNKNQPIELSYYGLYLLQYLTENHPDRVGDTDFIASRDNHAAEIYEQSRLEGYTPDGAQELAMSALMEGLHFSKHNMIVEVLWNEFADDLPPASARAFAMKLQPQLEEVFANYPLADDFAYTAEYDKLYTELTGAIVIYLEEYGV